MSKVRSVETDLAGAALGLDRRVVVEGRARLQVAGRCGRRSGRRARASSASWSWADGAVAERRPGARRSSGRCPGSRRVGAVAKRMHASSRPIATKPAGLPRSRAALGDQPVRADAGRDLDPGLLLDLVDQLAQHAQRLLDAGQVRVGLVEPHRLQALELRAHELPHLARLLAVGGEVGRDDDRRRAQPPRLRGGHRRADAELARLIARGRHHRARAGAGDDHRLALQLRPPDQLDGGVERVAVQMGDHALRGHATKGRRGPGRT